jgi:enoyl-CoA hydratase
MSQVTTEIRDGIAVVTITHPPRGYMNVETARELDAALDRIESEEAARVVVFTGGLADVFIRHYDVGEIAAMLKLVARGQLRPPTEGGGVQPIHALFDRVDRFAKPTIAAINGFCMGGGFEFALTCDIRLAQEGEYFIGLPEARIGILPGAGGTQRLPRVIGEARALDFILRGRTVPPREALALGLIHDLVPGPVLPAALARAGELAALPAHALRAIKGLVKGALSRPLAEGLEAEWTAFLDILARDQAARDLIARFTGGEDDIRRF